MKVLRACFRCFEPGHRRPECSSSTCGICSGPHHTLLHNHASRPVLNWRTTPAHPTVNPVMTNDAFISADSILNSSSVAHSHSPQRCFIPVVKINVKNGSTESFVTSVLDSCSELNIITPRRYDQLKLRGEPIGISIVGSGGIVTQVRTMLVDFLVIDIFGVETRVECIVLRETCGKALQIDNVVRRM